MVVPRMSADIPTKSDLADAAEEIAVETPAFAHATHAALFDEAPADLCDVCAARVTDADDDGYAVPGRGLYVWARGDERRYEEPPLCPGCAAAVGVSAMARWEIEEEEG